MSARSRLTRAAITLAALLALTGCGSGSDDRPPRATTSEVVSPARFAAVAAESETVTLNVHVPDEGSIPGTDLTIPYDDVTARRRDLPDRDTTIAIYCRTGRMSTIARRTLKRMGYRRLVELRGGMIAWRAAGRRLLPPADGAAPADTWPSVPPGRRSLAAQPVGRDHVPLNPPVSDRITVDVR